MPLQRPPNYVIASAAVSLGGLLNGFDTGSIGAIVHMPQFTASVGDLSATMLGITVSMIMLTGTLPSLFAGQLADKFGRLWAIAPGALLFGAGSLLQGTAYSLPHFIVGRAVGGVGQGIFLSNISVFICEISPARHRGALAGLPQFMAAAGVCLGYFTCYASVNLQSDTAWRLPYIVQCAVASVLAWVCFLLPDSPRWLMMHGRRAEARRALERLDFNMAEAERDILPAADQSPNLSPWQNFILLFRRPYRARTILALFILGMVQLSGIDAVVYYAPTLFKPAGLSSDSASFLASGVSSLFMFAISVPAFLLADKWGRRTSAITGGITLSTCMFLMGSLYAAGAVHSYGVARWLVIVAVFVFGLVRRSPSEILAYDSTWAIVGKIYASEIQPSHTRASANCVATGLSFFTNWLVAILTPILLEASAYGAYFLFGGFALCTVTVLVVYMPETRGRSLESIQEAFHRPSIRNSTQVLQAVVLRARHRTQNTRTAIGDNLELQEQESQDAGVTSGVEGVARSLRLDVAA
ncbi:general substrate transporter [Xylariomycetidae sp. FL2044]|nr:general substrate transporter [Xylariomycetidae sp. FL2044]